MATNSCTESAMQALSDSVNATSVSEITMAQSLLSQSSLRLNEIESEEFYDAEGIPMPIEVDPSTTVPVKVYQRVCASIDIVEKTLESVEDNFNFFTEVSKEGIKEGFAKICDSEFLTNMELPSIDTIYEWMEKMKPINLGCFYHDIVNSKSYADRVVVVTRIMEMYDMFWTPQLNCMKAIIIDIIVEVINFLFNKELPTYQAFYKTDEPSKIHDALYALGIDTPTDIDPSIMKYLGLVAGAFLLFTGGSLKILEQTPGAIMKRIKKTGTVIKSFRIFTEDLPKLASTVLNDVGSLFGYAYVAKEDKEVEEFRDDLLKFKVEVYRLHNVLQHNPQSLLTTPGDVLKLKTTMEEMNKIYDRLLRQKANNAVCKPLLDEIRPLVKAIDEYCMNSRAGHSTKIEPFCILITGDPGIGKSMILGGLEKAIGHRIKQEFPEMAHLPVNTYIRNSAEKYWSGYTGQTFCGWDDFGQIADDSDHADMMLIKNPNRTILPMGEVQDKGRLFSSIGILAAANQAPTNNSKVVKSIRALGRRLEIPIFASDPNYANFVQRHGMSPGDFEKSTGQKAMVADIHGNQIPYFDKVKYEHLTLFLMPRMGIPNPAPMRVTNFDEIVEMALNFFRHYRQQYLDSLVPITTQEVYEAHQRVRSEVGEAQNAINNRDAMLLADAVLNNEDLQNRAHEIINARRPPAPQQYNLPVAPGNHLPDLDAIIARNAEAAAIANEMAPFYPEEGIPQFQSKEEVESTAKSYIRHEQKKGKTILISGEPGTGKSTIIKKLLTMYPELISIVYGTDTKPIAITTPVLYIEDASISQESWSRAEEIIMRQEDGFTDYQLVIVTINPECLWEFMAKESQRWKRIERRCQIIDFNFAKNGKDGWFKSAPKRTAADLANGVPHEVAVTISSEGKVLGYMECFRLLENACKSINLAAFTQIICNSVPYVSRNMFDPNFIVEFSQPMYDAFKVLYEDPMQMAKWILTRKVKLVKGKLTEGIQIAQQFQSTSGAARPAFPATLSDFIVMINNSGFSSAKSFVTELRCTDGSVAIMPKKNDPRLINCFKICENIEITPTGVTDGTHIAQSNQIVHDHLSEYLQTAKDCAGKLIETSEQIEDTVVNALGVSTLIEQSSSFKKFISISVFCVKSFIAWKAISQYATRYAVSNIVVSHERSAAKRRQAKKANKKAKRELTNLSKQDYDSLRDAIKNHGSTAAKQKGYAALMQEYGESPFDEDGCIDDEFYDFIAEYETKLSIDEWERIERESAEKDKPSAPAVTKVDETLFIESAEKDKPVAPAVTKVDETLFIESAEKNSPTTPSITKVDETILLEKKSKLNVDVDNYFNNLKKNVNASSIPVTEAALDPALRSIANLARANLVPFGSVKADTFKRRVFALMVGARVGVTVYHAVEGTNHIQHKFNGQYFTYAVKIFKTFSKNDLAIFEVVDKKCPYFKNIIPHMPPKKTDLVKTYNNVWGVLFTPEALDSIPMMRNVKVKAVTTQVVQNFNGDFNENELLAYDGVATGYAYNNPILTEPGDCGSIVIANDTSIVHKLLSLHSAASHSAGFGALLCQEIFKDIDSLKITTQSKVQKKSFTPLNHEIEFRQKTDETLLGMPVVARLPEVRYAPVQTKLWTSPIATTEDSMYEPSILSPYDPRNKTDVHPYYHAIEKWNQPVFDMDEEELTEIAQEVGQYYADIICRRKITTKVLTKTEAINAGKNFNITQLNRESAPGYPWSKYEKKVKGFLSVRETSIGAYYGIDTTKESGRKLQHSIDSIINCSKIPGQFPNITFVGTLKDEPLKLKKIYACKKGDEHLYGSKYGLTETPETRSFAAAPLDYTITSRMYFSTIMGAIHAVRDECPVQIGIDASGLEWHTMITDMLKCSPIGTDTDFAGWDSTYPRAIKKKLHIVYNTIAQNTDPDWKPEDDVIRENLCYSEVQPKIMVALPTETVVVQAPNGQASGSPRTADDNSIGQLIALIYALRSILRKVKLPNFLPVKILMQYVRCKIYGDDGMMAIHPSLLPFIGFSKLKSEFDKIGLKCTPAAKNNIIQEHIEVTQLEFLKRKTVKIGKWYFGQLVPGSMEKMLQYTEGKAHHWYREPKTISFREDVIIATAQSNLFEAVLHGREYYNQRLKFLKEKFIQHGIEGTLLEYTDQIRVRDLPISVKS